MPPFNGRLFSPARAPMAETCAVDDEIAREGAAGAVDDARATQTERASTIATSASSSWVRSTRASSNTSPSSRRQTDADCLRRGGGARKSTGSFYTPQSITDYVVRRTLHPLVEERRPSGILRLRIVDPAMGSARVSGGGVPISRARLRTRAGRAKARA